MAHCSCLGDIYGKGKERGEISTLAFPLLNALSEKGLREEPGSIANAKVMKVVKASNRR